MKCTSEVLNKCYTEIVKGNGVPFIAVKSAGADCGIPNGYLGQDFTVLNISHSAMANVDLGDEFLTCNAKFNGVPTDLFIPYGSIVSIYNSYNTSQQWIFEDCAMLRRGFKTAESAVKVTKPKAKRPNGNFKLKLVVDNTKK